MAALQRTLDSHILKQFVQSSCIVSSFNHPHLEVVQTLYILLIPCYKSSACKCYTIYQSAVSAAFFALGQSLCVLLAVYLFLLGSLRDKILIKLKGPSIHKHISSACGKECGQAAIHVREAFAISLVLWVYRGINYRQSAQRMPMGVYICIRKKQKVCIEWQFAFRHCPVIVMLTCHRHPSLPSKPV